MDLDSFGKFLGKVLPRLSNRIQLSGLAIGVVVALLVQIITPGNAKAILSAGGIGVSLIIFGQLFHFLDAFRAKDRPVVFLGAFLIFCIFTGSMVVLTAYFVNQELSPSVSIDRTADFRGSGCDRDGKKKDVAFLTDTYALSGSPQLPAYYVATAEAYPGQTVRLFDLNSGSDEPMPPTETNAPDGNLIIYHWRVPVVNGTAKVKYEWTGAHPRSQEGLAFRSIYKIKDISARYLLPPNISVQNVKYAPSANTCFQKPPNEIECPDLNTMDRVTMAWDWSMWSSCTQ